MQLWPITWTYWIARGGWGDGHKDLGTWYDPHRTQKEIDTALWWQLSQPIHTAPSCGEYKLLKKVLDSAERFNQFDLDEQERIVASMKIFRPEEKLALI